MSRLPTTALLLVALAAAGSQALRPLKPDVPKQYHPEPKQDDVGEPVFLTPFIEAGDLEGAREAARVVDPLPDVGNAIDEHYAAYITVDEENDGNTFFWFFPATEVDPADAPVVVWLQGGPGSSSMFGLFEIHGPISVEYDGNGDTVGLEREYSWSRTANMLYIDNPLGAGYSYVNADALRTVIAEVNDDLYSFLTQFFTVFDSYQSNDFYIFGESYAGKWVPNIGKKVLDENAAGAELQINLQGVGIGDGFMSPVDTAVHADFLYALSLVDEKQADALRDIEDDIKTFAANDQWDEATDAWGAEQSLYLEFMGCDYVYEATQCNYDDEEDNYEEYIQREETRLAIHVGDTGFGTESGLVFASMSADFMKSAQAELEFLLNNIRVLIYDGNFDIICDHPGILKMFEKMETWTDIDEYYTTDRRPVSGDNLDTAGYIKEVGNLYMYVMRNAGHMVPRSQPKYAFEMFNNFLDDSF